MKNADEILKQMIEIMPYKIPLETHSYILEAMRIFANGACIEQKKLCVQNISDTESDNIFYIKEEIYTSILAVTP